MDAGHYRIRLPIHTNEPGSIELACEFDVIAYKNAPTPEWDISRLKLSKYSAYDKSEQNADIKMSFANPVLDKDNKTLEILLTAEKCYTYGEPYETEVLLDGKWYRVPFAGGGFQLPAFSIGPNAKNQKAACGCAPVYSCGILPAGQYRIVKEFDLQGPDSPEGYVSYTAKEIATAEFTVTEALWSEDDYIGMMNKSN